MVPTPCCGADAAKDQSYVVHMLGQPALSRLAFPVGHLDKPAVRRLAGELGLRTAAKPDSQDVCFITSAGGRTAFLGDRIPLRPGRVVDTAGVRLGEVAAIETVTVGQRRGIGLPGGGPKRYVVDVDADNATVVVGDDADLLQQSLTVTRPTWTHRPVEGRAMVQCSAHGQARPAELTVDGGHVHVAWAEPQRRVAPGQSIVFYDPCDQMVLGGGIAQR